MFSMGFNNMHGAVKITCNLGSNPWFPPACCACWIAAAKPLAWTCAREVARKGSYGLYMLLNGRKKQNVNTYHDQQVFKCRGHSVQIHNSIGLFFVTNFNGGPVMYPLYCRPRLPICNTFKYCRFILSCILYFWFNLKSEKWLD